MTNKNIWIFTFSLMCLFTTISCKKFLDAKPDSSLALPNTLKDLDAIMDTELRINENYPDVGEIASDYFYLNDADWSTKGDEYRNTYLWGTALPPQRNAWADNYVRVLDANVVLEQVDKASLGNLTEADRQRIKGEALFIRGFTFYHLAQIFAPVYESTNSNNLLGIPLRVTADINIPTVRSNLSETYEQVIKDLKQAAQLLPVIPLIKTRPSKPAAFAALSKTYLSMQDYVNAGIFADSCLKLYSKLIDYNILDTVNAGQFVLLNDEVIFQATVPGVSEILTNSVMNVNPDLYALYQQGDLRKPIFYKLDNNGVRSFYGDYANYLYGTSFGGLATDEMLLNRAECNVRNGNITAGLQDLNTLLEKRWKKNDFSPFSTNNQEIALRTILTERNKELAFRGGIRWTDLRRLNKEPRFAVTLTRTIQGTTYTLNPNSKGYVFLIPNEVIEQTGMQQN